MPPSEHQRLYLARRCDRQTNLETQVRIEEVEQLFRNEPRFERLERGHRPGEDLYHALGQTDGGRYLIVFFIHKSDRQALIVTARDMTQKEYKRYGRK